jgi:hypothetical protein
MSLKAFTPFLCAFILIVVLVFSCNSKTNRSIVNMVRDRDKGNKQYAVL